MGFPAVTVWVQAGRGLVTAIDLGAVAPVSRAHGGDTIPFTAADLGFERCPGGGWWKRLGDRSVEFRPLRRVPELLGVEALQREVFGVTDRDLAAASQLVVVPETGGEVIGAFVGAADAGKGADSDPALVDEVLAGYVIGWGGFVEGRPRLVSDMLGVRGDARNLGLGAELKKLQAVVALERGFGEIVWTVDPLRAANARLNFEKLGAIADRYEEDRYGAGYGAGLYGGLPTDRLHVTWDLRTRRVEDRLRGRTHATTREQIADLQPYDAAIEQGSAVVFLPADIDRLIGSDPAGAREWRFVLRETLRHAFDRGYAITGFVAGVDETGGRAAYVIERRSPEV